MPSIDYQAVKKSIRLRDAMRSIGITISHSWLGAVRGPCPSPCCSDTRCAMYREAEGVWYCHRCKRGGSVIDLFIASMGLGPVHAVREMCKRFRIPIPYLPRSKGRQTRKPRFRNRPLAERGNDKV